MSNAGKQLKLTDVLEAREPATDLMKAVASRVSVDKKMAKDFTPEEIAEIRRRMREKSKEEQVDQEKELEERRERREKTIKVKKIARELEKGNQEKVILFPSYSRNTDKLSWYKLGDFSALYYVYRMADRMGRSVKVLKDTDKFAKMKAIASVKDIDGFLEQAMKLKEFKNYEKTLDGIYILYLKKPLTDEEVGILRRTESQRRDMMHNILKPKKADTRVYQAILMIDRQVLPRANKLGKGNYGAVGDAMVKQIMELTKIYLGYAHGYIETNEMKRKLSSLIDGIMAGVILLGENNVWGYDVATSVGENINSLRRMVDEVR